MIKLTKLVYSRSVICPQLPNLVLPIACSTIKSLTLMIKYAPILLLASLCWISPSAATAQPKPSKKKVKNIILMIGDGMGLPQMYAGMTANRGKLSLEKCPVVGLHKTYSYDDYITDSAAGATAFSIGQKTYNGAIGVDKDTIRQETILETADRRGLATGMVATSSITHATPASFIAHQRSRTMDRQIAADFLSTDIEVFIGGGAKFFREGPNGRNLIQELEQKGYQVRYNLTDAAAVTSGKLAVLTAPEQNGKFSAGRGDLLRQGTLKSLELLKSNKKGFFLMVEGSQIDWGGHDNDLQYVIDEMLDFDRTIAEVLRFAEQDGETLVVITADHECGGLTLTGGNLLAGKPEGHFSTTHHTAVPVPVYAYGPGAELFGGIYENTDIYFKMMKLLRLPLPAKR